MTAIIFLNNKRMFRFNRYENITGVKPMTKMPQSAKCDTKNKGRESLLLG